MFCCEPLWGALLLGCLGLSFSLSLQHPERSVSHLHALPAALEKHRALTIGNIHNTAPPGAVDGRAAVQRASSPPPTNPREASPWPLPRLPGVLAPVLSLWAAAAVLRRWAGQPAAAPSWRWPGAPGPPTAVCSAAPAAPAPAARPSELVPLCIKQGRKVRWCDDLTQLVLEGAVADANAKPHRELPEFSITTMNVLAPIHRRLADGTREAAHPELYVSRNVRILELLLQDPATVICLQEVWICSKELVAMYQGALGPAGYNMYFTPRTHCRGDGLLTLVAADRFDVLDQCRVFYNDCGDRVAHLLRLRAKGSAPGTNELLLINTHLMFPHDENARLIRLRECTKLLAFLHQYATHHDAAGLPVVMCGDWNGRPGGHVARFMQSQGFVSVYDTVANPRTPWVSHLNHHGAAVGVDYVWLLNPSACRAGLSCNWCQLVCGSIVAQLVAQGFRTQEQAFSFFDTEGAGAITPLQFVEGVRRLGLTGEEGIGLVEGEVAELAQYIDANSNGVLEPEELRAFLDVRGAMALLRRVDWDPVEFLRVYALEHATCPLPPRSPQADLAIRSAELPPPCAAGAWPAGYETRLSDHAPLSACLAFPPATGGL